MVQVGDDDTFSLEDVYHEGVEVPKNPVDPIYIKQEQAWEDITFSESEASDEMKDALAAISTQFHYIALAQLTLLGHIIAENSNMRAKRLASLIVSSRTREVDAWGRYLRILGIGGNVHPEVENYFQQLYADDEPVSALIGMTLLDVLLRCMYDNLDGSDITFQTLLGRQMNQAEENIDLVEYYLQYWDSKLSETDRGGVTKRVRYYTTLIEECIAACKNELDTINIDSTQVLEDFDAAAHKISPR